MRTLDKPQKAGERSRTFLIFKRPEAYRAGHADCRVVLDRLQDQDGSVVPEAELRCV